MAVYFVRGGVTLSVFNSVGLALCVAWVRQSFPAQGSGGHEAGALATAQSGVLRAGGGACDGRRILGEAGSARGADGRGVGARRAARGALREQRCWKTLL